MLFQADVSSYRNPRTDYTCNDDANDDEEVSIRQERSTVQGGGGERLEGKRKVEVVSGANVHSVTISCAHSESCTNSKAHSETYAETYYKYDAHSAAHPYAQ